MPRRLLKHLRSASLVVFALAATAVLAGAVWRPRPSLTWTRADTEYHLALIGSGPSLFSIHDPSLANLPRPTPPRGREVDPRWTDIRQTHQSCRYGILRSQWEAHGNAGSPLTFSMVSVPLLYPWLAALGLILPGLSLARLLFRWTLATSRDPDRRARALFRAGGAVAALLLLAAVTLTIGGMTDSIEASTSFADRYTSLHSRRPHRLEWQFHHPVGPWIDPHDPQTLAAYPNRPSTHWSVLGVTFQASPNFIARVNADHYNAHPNTTEVAIDFLRPTRDIHVLMPCWFPLPLLLAWPAWWLTLSRRRRRQTLRRRAGLCLNCGYDLRSSPTRCPECGNPTAALAQS